MILILYGFGVVFCLGFLAAAGEAKIGFKANMISLGLSFIWPLTLGVAVGLVLNKLVQGQEDD